MNILCFLNKGGLRVLSNTAINRGGLKKKFKKKNTSKKKKEMEYFRIRCRTKTSAFNRKKSESTGMLFTKNLVLLFDIGTNETIGCLPMRQCQIHCIRSIYSIFIVYGSNGQHYHLVFDKQTFEEIVEVVKKLSLTKIISSCLRKHPRPRFINNMRH